ncbi:unnamed protein product, partial [Prorocentrum cordatum]
MAPDGTARMSTSVEAPTAGSGFAAVRAMQEKLTIEEVRVVLEEIGAEGAMKNQDAFRALLQKKDEKLSMAAQLVRESTVANKCCLADVLADLATTSPLPADVTTWLTSRLRSFQPDEASTYTEAVLEGLVMKCDEFENIHLLKSERLHPEAWNFRKTNTADLPVFGSGQCHLDGIKFLAKDLKEKGYDKVLWFNMREEPQRLCKDCVAAADNTEGKTLPVYYQVGAGDNIEKQLKAPADRSFTVRDAYDHLKTEAGMPELIYSRVPIADETAPEEGDFDQLVRELKPLARRGVKNDTALVFNCQMGRGRTTTGMVCGSILLLAARGWTPPKDVPQLPEPSAKERNRTRGEFTSVLELLRLAGMAMAGRGLAAKLLADQCCDDCGHAQNMVEAIVQCTDAASKAEPGAARSPEFWAKRAHNYLERYAYVLLFAAYALEDVHSGFERSFGEWSRSHWQFKRVIKHQTLEHAVGHRRTHPAGLLATAGEQATPATEAVEHLRHPRDGAVLRLIFNDARRRHVARATYQDRAAGLAPVCPLGSGAASQDVVAAARKCVKSAHLLRELPPAAHATRVRTNATERLPPVRAKTLAVDRFQNLRVQVQKEHAKQ